MRGLKGCFTVLVVVVVLVLIVGAGALFLFRDRLPSFGNLTLFGTSPTVVPVTLPVVNAPPVATSDTCAAVASASGVVSAEEKRSGRPQGTLPNGRPLPNTQPNRVNIPNRPVQNQVLIQFTDNSSQQERNEYIRTIQGRSRRQIDKLNTYVVTVPQNVSMSDLPSSPIVVRIEPDYKAGAAQVGTTPPNDARYGEQWAFPVIGLPEGWSGLNAGSTVVVAVIDSGVCLNHPDLAGRIVGGFDFVDDDNDPQDQFGHGCGVAGVIAANANNGIGVAGVAPNASIMPLRVLDNSGLGNYSDISAAIVYAADNGARVINLSLAGPSASQIMAEAVAYAVGRGVTVVAAAGNFGTSTPYYPAAFPGVIAVSSIDNNLQRSSFSNYGTHVKVQAPGRDILTTSMNGDYEMMTGTSFAAPQVAGLAAVSQIYNVPLNTEDDIVFLYPPDVMQACG